jgi:hypothetical protein
MWVVSVVVLRGNKLEIKLGLVFLSNLYLNRLQMTRCYPHSMELTLPSTLLNSQTYSLWEFGATCGGSSSMTSICGDECVLSKISLGEGDIDSGLSIASKIEVYNKSSIFIVIQIYHISCERYLTSKIICTWHECHWLSTPCQCVCYKYWQSHTNDKLGEVTIGI